MTPSNWYVDFSRLDVERGELMRDEAIEVGADDTIAWVGPTLFAAQQALAQYRKTGVANPDDAHALTRLEARGENFRRRLDVGRIEVGARADFVAYPGSPLDDIALLRNPTIVVRGGHQVDQPASSDH